MNDKVPVSNTNYARRVGVDFIEIKPDLLKNALDDTKEFVKLTNEEKTTHDCYEEWFSLYDLIWNDVRDQDVNEKYLKDELFPWIECAMDTNVNEEINVVDYSKMRGYHGLSKLYDRWKS